MCDTMGLHQPSHERDSCGIGLVARLDARPGTKIIRDALSVLRNLEHRGAVSGDGKSGDGAGLLSRIPDSFFRSRMSVPLPGTPMETPEALDGLPYAVGMFFLPSDPAGQRAVRALIEYMAARERLDLLGWRDVPVVPQVLGGRALAALPRIVQAVFARPSNAESGEEFERRLYLLRKGIEREASDSGLSLNDFSVPSLSCRTIVYKGMFVASQFSSFYPDLEDPLFSSPYAVVHQRYSTNTFPSWPLAQPFRMIAHNGEINTLRKNVAAMKARQATLESPRFGSGISRLFPVIQEGGSDSSAFDNVFELLVRAGRAPSHALRMMVPEPYGPDTPREARDFYEYHSALMESWDGPAALVFTDGVSVGAAADRNGLRPFRYTLTSDGLFVGASEAGALEIDDALVAEKGKLAPGRMLAVDFRGNRLLSDEQVRGELFRGRPYGDWLREHRIEIPGLQDPSAPPIGESLGGASRAASDPESRSRRDVYFGLDDSARVVLEPMVSGGVEGTAAMGTRKAPAILSGRLESLFSYFRQIFAQVTNPPIDPVREGSVMSLASFIGRERNLLDESPLHCNQLKLAHPVLTNEDMARIRAADLPGIRSCTVSTAFSLEDAGGGTRPAPGSRLKAAVEAIRTAAELRVDEGYTLVILSDREVDANRASVPALLALAAVNRHLVDRGKRHRTGLIVETGEAWEIHHLALLVGYGASAVNPYLVLDRMADLAARVSAPGTASPSPEEARGNYVGALKKGLLKTMSKMGISPVSSYRGGGLFEAFGLSAEFVDEFFPGTESRLGGIGLPELEEDIAARHAAAFSIPFRAGKEPLGAGNPSDSASVPRLRDSGPWTPRLAALLARAVRQDDEEAYREYARGITARDRPFYTLRDLFELRGGTPLPLERVEPESAILARLTISAMSCGAISPEAHEALAGGADSVGSWSDSGEGGEDEEREKPDSNGRSRVSASRQVASGRFGVTARYLARARELQIKMAQGAKPGEGGQLPAAKVDEYIAKLRHTVPGTLLISPPPHHDIYSIEDLSQLIHDLRCVNPSARIAVKLAAQAGVGTVAAGTAKAGADCVVISSGDGGTGAAPLSSLDYAGNAWELALPEVRQVLAANGMAERVSIQVDGRLRTGRDVVIAAILGAREFGFGTAALISLGCVACGRCHQDRCPVGIATQRTELRARFAGSPDHVARFLRFVAREVRELLASLGLESLDSATGRHDLVDFHGRGGSGRGALLDFSRIRQSLELAKSHLTLWSEGAGEPLVLPPPPAGLAAFERLGRGSFPVPEAEENLADTVCEALASGRRIRIERKIRSSDRSIGASLSGEIVRRGLYEPSGSAALRFEGSGGQSFGAFLVRGLELELIGQANDFVGKGLSGGTIILRPRPGSPFPPEANIIAGNVCLLGATSGRVFICGRVGERFAIRNSGALAVAEGAGDNACEYMTGGRVVLLGRTGGNFGAGMSGGVAFVLDEDGTFPGRTDAVSVVCRPLSEVEGEDDLRRDLELHLEATGSPRAAAILSDWASYRPRFLQVSPRT